jgi:hypothetical protein
MANDKDKMEYVDEVSEDAWHHHYTVNPHHPEFFIWNVKDEYSITGWKVLDAPINDPPTMPIVYIMEMLCDWAAMSKGKDDFNYINWWINHESNLYKKMNGETKEIIKKITAIILPNEFELVKDDPRWLI